MVDVRIFKPSKNATQSGRNNIKMWVMEFEPNAPKNTDFLMGWIGSVDTKGQVRIKFNSKEEAIAFAKKNGLTPNVQESNKRKINPKNYADNFSFYRSS
tara:strand:- start:149 stop:445 length:297 start_codon:yes stop_codon:yes gene_type:complete